MAGKEYINKHNKLAFLTSFLVDPKGNISLHPTKYSHATSNIQFIDVNRRIPMHTKPHLPPNHRGKERSMLEGETSNQ